MNGFNLHDLTCISIKLSMVQRNSMTGVYCHCLVVFSRMWYLEYAVFPEVREIVSTDWFIRAVTVEPSNFIPTKKHPRRPKGSKWVGEKKSKRARKNSPEFVSPVKTFFLPHLLPLGLRGWQRSWIAEKRSWLVRSQISMLPTQFQKKCGTTQLSGVS